MTLNDDQNGYPANRAAQVEAAKRACGNGGDRNCHPSETVIRAARGGVDAAAAAAEGEKGKRS